MNADALRHDHAGIDAGIEPVRQSHHLRLRGNRRKTQQQRRDGGTVKQTTHFLDFPHTETMYRFLSQERGAPDPIIDCADVLHICNKSGQRLAFLVSDSVGLARAECAQTSPRAPIPSRGFCPRIAAW